MSLTILLAYQTTPHSTTGITPTKLFLGQNLHTRLDLLKPNTAEHVESKQWNQKSSHDNSIPSHPFTDGQSVLVRVYGHNHKWTCGTIFKSTGPLSYIVKLPNGTTWQCHQDHLKHCREQLTTPTEQLPDTVPADLLVVPSTTTNLQPVPNSVPCHYPQRI